MAISFQSKSSVFPSSSKTNNQTSKSSVQTSVATSGKAPAVSRGSSSVASVRQDRVEISREAEGGDRRFGTEARIAGRLVVETDIGSSAWAGETFAFADTGHV